MGAPRWKLAVLVLGLPALAVAGLWLWVSSAADRRWDEMLRHQQGLEEEARRRDGSREVLRGEPLPGNAWENYEAAVAVINATPGATPSLSDWTTKPSADSKAEGILLAKLSNALDLARRGTRHADAGFPDPTSPAGSWAKPLYSQLHQLAHLLLVQEHQELEAGQGMVAAELLLDVVRLSQDYSRNTHPSRRQIAGEQSLLALEELRRLLVKGLVPGPALEELERELEILDRTMPPFGPTMLNYQAWVAHEIRDYGAMDFLRSEGKKLSWRYAFSPRLQVVDLYFDLGERVRHVLDCDRMTWGEECSAWERFEAGAGTTSLRKHARIDRETRARLRLLRLLLHARRTGEWLTLDDPLGGKLQHADSESTLRAWSVGQDGKDDGGKGSFEGRPGQDLLIELPRR